MEFVNWKITSCVCTLHKVDKKKLGDKVHIIVTTTNTVQVLLERPETEINTSYTQPNTTLMSRLLTE